MPYDAGDIESRLTLDRDPFTAELRLARRQANEFERRPIRVRLELGGADKAVRDMSSVIAMLNVLDKKVARPRIELMGSQVAIGGIQLVGVELDKLNKKNTKIRIDIDNSTLLTQIATANTNLDGLTRKRTTKVDVDVDRDRLGAARASIGGFFSGLGSSLLSFGRASTQATGELIEGVFSGFRTLTDGAFRSISSISGVVGAIASVGIALGAMSIIGVAAFGAMTLAVGLLATAIGALPALLTGILAPIGLVVLGMEGIKRAAEPLKDEFAQLKTSVEDAFERALRPALENIAPLFPIIEDGAVRLIEKMGDLATKASEFITTAEGMDSVRRVGDGVNTMFDRMGVGLGILFTGIWNVLDTEENWSILGDTVGGVAGRFGSLFDEMDRTGLLTESLGSLRDILFEITDLFGEFALAGMEFTNGAAPGLTSFFDSIGDTIERGDWTRFGEAWGAIAKAFGDIIESVPQETWSSIVDATEDFADTLKDPKVQEAILLMIAGIDDTIRVLGEAVVAFSDFVLKMQAVGDALNDLNSWLTTNAENFRTWAKDNDATMVGFTGSLQGRSDDQVRVLTTVFTNGFIMLYGIWLDGWDKIKTAYEMASDLIAGGIGIWWDSLQTRFDESETALSTGWSVFWGDLTTKADTSRAGIRLGIDVWWRGLLDKFGIDQSSLSLGWSMFWDNLKTKADTLMEGIRLGIDVALGRIQGLFQTAVNGIRNVWEGLKEAAAAPVRFAVNVVLNGLIGGWNAVSRALNLGLEVPQVSLGFATGGKVIGPGTTTSDSIPARLSRDEHVWTAAEVHGAGGHDNVERMRQMARNGALNRYAMGGPVVRPDGALGFADGGQWRTLERVVKSQFPTARRTSGYRAGDRGYHGQGAAVDMAGPTPGDASFIMAMNKWIAAQYGASAEELIYTPGINLLNGRPHTYNAATRADHNDHVHWADTGAAASGGSAGKAPDGGIISDVIDWIQEAFNPFKALADGLFGKLGEFKGIRGAGGIYGDIIWGMVKKLGTSMLDKAKAAADLRNTETIAGTAVPAGSGVERWRSVVHQALARTGNPREYDNITLRRMNQESGGNPRAINNWDSNAKKGTPSKGLMQVIDPTFRSYRDPGLINDIWDPLANIVASMRYAKARYGSLPTAYNRAGGYDNGGPLMPGLTMAYNGTGSIENVVPNDSNWTAKRNMIRMEALERRANAQTASLGNRSEIKQLINAIQDARPMVGSVMMPQGTTLDQLASRLAFEHRHALKERDRN